MTHKKQNADRNYNNSYTCPVNQFTAVGKKKRFDNMRYGLSMFFDFLKHNPLYADNRNSKGKYVPVFITLTYPTNQHWKPKDITDYITKIKKFAKRNWDLTIPVAWVAETTKNNVIHYHLVTWIPRTERLPIPNQPQLINGRKYPPMWRFNAQIEGVRKGVFGYMTKYMSKGCFDGLVNEFKDDNNQNTSPRLFGYSGLSKEQRQRIAYYRLPDYVRKAFGFVRVGDAIRRVKGGFKLVKKNIVDEIYNYYSYCEPSLVNNFTKVVYNLNNTYYVDYHFGRNWSQLPEPSVDDIWIPF